MKKLNAKQSTAAVLAAMALTIGGVGCVFADGTDSNSVTNINIYKTEEATGIQLGDNSRARGNGSIATGKNSIAIGKNAVATGGNENKETIEAKLKENQQKLDEISALTKKTETLSSELTSIRNYYADVIEAGERVKAVQAAKEKAYENWQTKLNTYNTETANSKDYLNECQAKIDDLNSRLTGVSQLTGVDITSDENLTTAANKLKGIAEKDTTLNLSTDFYKDYIKSYYQALGDLRKSYFIANSTYVKMQDGVTYTGGHTSYSDSNNSGQEQVINSYAISSVDKETIKAGIKHQVSNYDVSFCTNYGIGKFGAMTDELSLLNNGDLATYEEYSTALNNGAAAKDYFKDFFVKCNDPFMNEEVRNSIVNSIDSKIDYYLKQYEIAYYQERYEKTGELSWLDKKKQAINESAAIESNYNSLTQAVQLKVDAYKSWYKENITDIEDKNKVTTNTLTSELEKALGISKDAMTKKLAELENLKKEAEQAKTNYESIKQNQSDIYLSEQYNAVMKQLEEKAAELKSSQERLDALKAALTLNDLSNVGENAMAVGTDSLATGSNSMAIGTSSVATGANSIAVGNGATVTGDNSIAVGYGNAVLGNNSGAFGDPNTVYGSGSYVIGNDNTVGKTDDSTHTPLADKGNNTFILGSNVNTVANNSVVLGYNSEASEDNVVSVGSSGNKRRIVNVADAVKDYDAVNKKQMEDAGNKVLQDSKDYTDGKLADLTTSDPLSVKYTDSTKSAVDIGSASISTTGAGTFGSVNVGGTTYIDGNGFNANDKVISSVAGPVKGTDAANKSYVDTSVADTLQNSKDYTDGKLADLTVNDPLSVKYSDNTKSAVDIGSASFSTTGAGSFGSVNIGGTTYIDGNGFNANSKVISNVAAAEKDTDAVNKKQMEDADNKVLKDSKEYTDGKVSDLEANDALNVKYSDNTKSTVDIGSASFSTTGAGSFGSVNVGGTTYIDGNGFNANSKVISNVAVAEKDTDAVNKKQMEDADNKVLKDSKEYTDGKVSDLEANDALNVKYSDNTKSIVDIGSASFSTTGAGSFGSVNVGGTTYIDGNGFNANSKVISNVAVAEKDTDAVNKKQMEDADKKVLKDSKDYTDSKVSDLEVNDALNVKYTDDTKSAVDIGSASFSTTGAGSFGSVNVGGTTYIDSNGLNANDKVISNVASPLKDTDAANKSYVDVSVADTLQNSKDYTDGKVADLTASDALNVKYTDNTKSAVDIGSASISTTGVGNFGSISVGGTTYINGNGINANSKVISNVADAEKDTDAVNKKQMEDADDKVLKDSKVYTDGKVSELEANDALNVKYTDNTKNAVDIGSASISTTGAGNFGSLSIGSITYINGNGINANSKVISNVANAVKDTDAVNKKQMEDADDKVLKDSKSYTDGKVSELEANDELNVKYTDNTKSAVDIGSASIITTGAGSFGSVSVGGNTYIYRNGLNANGKVISNVAGPVKDTDAANKSYVDVSAADTLQNAKDYTDGKVANLAASDALSVKYTDNTKSSVDIGSASISTTGAGSFGSVNIGSNTYIDDKGLNANGKVISNVAGPVKDTDAANKSYVDVSAANTLQNAKDYTDGKVANLTASDALSVKYTDNTKSAVDIGSASISTTGAGNFGSVSVGGNTYIDDKGIDANSKVISNVAAAVKANDAVNKKQMEDADDKVLATSMVYTDTQIKNVTADTLREANNYTDMRVNTLDQKINKAGAAAAAMAGLHPLDFDEEQKLNFAAATGSYQGSSAVALGMFYRPNEHVMFNLSGSTSGSEHMYTFGASFALDRSSVTHVSSRRALTEKVKQLSQVNEAVIKQSVELKAKNDELQTQIAELRQMVMEMKKSA